MILDENMEIDILCSYLFPPVACTLLQNYVKVLHLWYTLHQLLYALYALVDLVTWNCKILLVILINWSWYILGISYTNIYDDWIHFYMFLSICYILTLLKPKLFSWSVFLTGNHCIWEFCEIQEFILVTLCDCTCIFLSWYLIYWCNVS